MNYRLKPQVSLFVKEDKNGCEAEFLFSITRKVVHFELNKKTVEALRLLDGARSLLQISGEIGAELSELEELVQVLMCEGILERSVTQPSQDKVYSREINFFSSYSVNDLDAELFLLKLQESKVVIIGVGGIGSWVAYSLARSGVGSLAVVDPDIVSDSNISHQALYTLNDVGQHKTSVLRRVCEAINPNMLIQEVHSKLDGSFAAGLLFTGVDLIVNCADSPDTDETNMCVSRIGIELNIPHLLCGGYEGHISSIGQTVIPRKTSCWQCYIEGGQYEKMSRGFVHVPISTRETQGGTIAPIAGISGNIQALEAIRVLTGYEKPRMLNRKGEFDFSTYRMSSTRILKYKECSLCGFRKESP